MQFLTDLFQQEMFVAVASYLTVGLVFLVFFYYLERKWENDLARYQLSDVKLPAPSDPSYPANVFPLYRNIDKDLPLTGATEFEMQVIAGEIMAPETSAAANADHATPSTASITPITHK